MRAQPAGGRDDLFSHRKKSVFEHNQKTRQCGSQSRCRDQKGAQSVLLAAGTARRLRFFGRDYAVANKSAAPDPKPGLGRMRGAALSNQAAAEPGRAAEPMVAPL